MDVEGLLALGLEHLDESVAPVGLLSRGLYGGQTPEPPPRLSLALFKCKGSAGDVCFVHRLLLSLTLASLVPLRRTDDFAPVAGLENREALRFGLVGRIVLVRRFGRRQGGCLGRLAD